MDHIIELLIDYGYWGMLIAAFLAVLEMAKNKTIFVSGEGEDIQIELLEGNEEA